MVDRKYHNLCGWRKYENHREMIVCSFVRSSSTVEGFPRRYSWHRKWRDGEWICTYKSYFPHCYHRRWKDISGEIYHHFHLVIYVVRGKCLFCLGRKRAQVLFCTTTSSTTTPSIYICFGRRKQCLFAGTGLCCLIEPHLYGRWPTFPFMCNVWTREFM